MVKSRLSILCVIGALGACKSGGDGSSVLETPPSVDSGAQGPFTAGEGPAISVERIPEIAAAEVATAAAAASGFEGGNTDGQFIGTGTVAIASNGPWWITIHGNGTWTNRVRVEGCAHAEVLDLQIAINGVWATMSGDGHRQFRTTSGSQRPIGQVRVLVRHAYPNCTIDLYANEGGGPTPPPSPLPPPGQGDFGAEVCNGTFSTAFSGQWIACYPAPGASVISARTLVAVVGGCAVGATQVAIQTEPGGPWRNMTSPQPASAQGGIWFRTQSGLSRPIYGVNFYMVSQFGQSGCRVVVGKLD